MDLENPLSDRIYWKYGIAGHWPKNGGPQPFADDAGGSGGNFVIALSVQ